VSASATGEHALQAQLAEVEVKLPQWTLAFAADGTVKNFEDLIGDMEAAAFALKGMSLSRFSEIVGDRLKSASASVQLYLRVVRSMDVLQRLWLVLRGVMESPEADVIMPVERASFVRVDGVWRELLLRTSKRNPQVHALVTAKDAQGFEAKLLECAPPPLTSEPLFCINYHLLFRFKSHRCVRYTKTLEACRMKLDQFVDLKCRAFPRLQLLHRTEVVRLLACGALSEDNMRVYQAAARACFPGVEELQVRQLLRVCLCGCSVDSLTLTRLCQFHRRREEEGGGWFVKGVRPIECRSFPLDSRVFVTGAVDAWLRDTLLRCVRACVRCSWRVCGGVVNAVRMCVCS